jgi:O-acetyl-ADP-ribose deacetylase (regulator of RNase III)
VERRFPGSKLLRLQIGDITRVPADVIVNAANSGLAGGGGVDGAIHRAGGPSIMEELRGIRHQIGSCPTGTAVATGAGELPARWIFHAVGPIYRDGKQGEADLLASCYRSCLKMAADRQANSISFPSISTGAYGYPVAKAAALAAEEVMRHLGEPNLSPREIVFVLFDRCIYDAYALEFQKW